MIKSKLKKSFRCLFSNIDELFINTQSKKFKWYSFFVVDSQVLFVKDG